MGNVYVFFADGFEEIEAITCVDVLKRAGLNVEMVSVTGENVVTGAHDIPLVCDALYEACDFSDAALVLLPGGMPGAETLSKHEGIQGLVRSFMEKERLIAAICAAPMVLGKMGLLQHKKVTCYPGFEQYLKGASCIGEPVVKDGNVITGQGPGAAMDFALKIVGELCGKGKVVELEEAMCVRR